MKKYNTLKKYMICLFAVICVSANLSSVAHATEVDEPDEPEVKTEENADTTVKTTGTGVEASEAPAEGSSVAIIEIQDYTIEGGVIEAGKEIKVNLTLHNTASVTPATNIMMTMTNSSGIVYPSYGSSNQVYIGALGADDTKSVTVPLSIGSNFIGDAVDLTCTFDYVTGGQRVSNSAAIVIPTSGGSTIGVKSIDVASHAIVNGKSLLSMNFVNQSSANITDAQLVIDGNVSSGSKNIKLDTVYAGKSYTEDYYVIFKEAGNQEVSVALTYTDVDGQQVTTDLGTYGVTVSNEEVAENHGGKFNAILGIVGKGIAAIFLAGAAFVSILFIKKR